jgi:hypothetical protein
MKFTPKSGTVKIKIALEMKPSMMGKSVRGPALSAANGPVHPRKSITTSPLMKIANGGTGTGTNTPTKYDPLLQEMEEGDENESWWWQAMKEKFSFFSSFHHNQNDKKMKKEEHHQGPPHVDGAKVIGTLKISIIDSGPGIDPVRISFYFLVSVNCLFIHSISYLFRTIKRNYFKNMFKSLPGNYRKVKEVD